MTVATVVSPSEILSTLKGTPNVENSWTFKRKWGTFVVPVEVLGVCLKNDVLPYKTNKQKGQISK